MKANFDVPNYSFDLYIDKKERCWIIDINPLSQFSKTVPNSITQHDPEIFCRQIRSSPPHAPLVTWKDLIQFHYSTCTEMIPEFRCIQNQDSAQPENGLSSHRVPLELVKGDLSMETISELNNKLNDIYKPV